MYWSLKMGIGLGYIPEKKFNPSIDPEMLKKSQRLKKVFDYESIDLHITVCMFNPTNSVTADFVSRLTDVVESICYQADRANLFCPNLDSTEINPNARIKTVWIRTPEPGMFSKLRGKKFNGQDFKVKAHQILTYRGLDKYSFLINGMEFINLKESDKLIDKGPSSKRTLLIQIPDDLNEIRNIIQ
jgi:hypothetical protein